MVPRQYHIFLLFRNRGIRPKTYFHIYIVPILQPNREIRFKHFYIIITRIEELFDYCLLEAKFVLLY